MNILGWSNNISKCQLRREKRRYEPVKSESGGKSNVSWKTVYGTGSKDDMKSALEVVNEQKKGQRMEIARN